MTARAPVLLAILVLTPAFAAFAAPAAAGEEGGVALVASSDTSVHVRGVNYEARFSWLAPGATSYSSRPLAGELVVQGPGGTQTIAFAEETRAAVSRTFANPIVPLAELPWAVTSVRVEVEGADAIKVFLRLSLAPFDPEAKNVTGEHEITFLADRVEHAYALRAQSAYVNTVRLTHDLSFSSPYDTRRSIGPLGQVVADDGQSLDQFNGAGGGRRFGFHYADSSGALPTLAVYRIAAGHYTNYLAPGQWRSAPASGLLVTHHYNQDVGVPGVTTQAGTTTVDLYYFPRVGTTPLELYAEMAAYRRAREANPPPPSTESPYPLRCPAFPLRPDGAPCERVVVAVVDSGVNPYHTRFRRPGWTAHPSSYLEGFAADAPALRLTFGGDYARNLADDALVWGEVERGRLYTIPGTNVAGAISFGEILNAHYVPVLDEEGHGTATAGVVTDANPDVLLVVVEANSTSMASALAWVADQPWIDVVSLSWGTLGNTGAAVRGTTLASDPVPWTRLLAERGKLVLVASGNEPGVGVTDSWDGPPWVVSVGGAHGATRSDYGMGTELMDVVSDFHHHDLSDARSVYGVVQKVGTSFSCPRVAGALSRAVLDARAVVGHAGGIVDGALVVGAGGGALADGRATPGELRDAMNATASYLPTEGYAPDWPSELPQSPVAPWVQQGWGYVAKDDGPRIAATLLGLEAPPPKPPEARLHMGAAHEARRILWG